MGGQEQAAQTLSLAIFFFFAFVIVCFAPWAISSALAFHLKLRAMRTESKTEKSDAKRHIHTQKTRLTAQLSRVVRVDSNICFSLLFVCRLSE
jgi:uncharacterized membrane protein